jgi:hypothetical protein
VILATEELRVALGELRNAHEAKERNLKAQNLMRTMGLPINAETAFTTLENVERAVAKVVSLLPPEV